MSADVGAGTGDVSRPVAERTGRQSRRLAPLVAAIGTLALVLGVGAPLPAIVAVGGLATAVGLRYAGASRPLIAVSSRTLGALGAFAGGAGAVAIAATGDPGAWYGPFTVGLGAWLAVVATAGALEGHEAVDRLRAVGSTLTVAGALVGVGLLTGATAAVTGSDAVGGLAVLVRYLARAVLYGGRPASALPIVLFLGGLLAATLLVALFVTPLHVVLGPRADQEDVAAVEQLTRGLLLCAVGACVAALVLYAAGIAPAFVGPFAVLAQSVRALLGLCILFGLLVAVAAAILPHWPESERQSARGVLATTIAGSLVAVLFVSLVAGLARDGTVSVGPGATLPANQLLASVVAFGVLARPTLAVLQRTTELLHHAPIRTRLLGPAALVAGSIGAASAGAVATVVVGIAASLLLWDALAYRSGLRAEVLGADTAAVERRHLGTTTGLLLAGVVVAFALYGVTALLGPALGGQPLVVVVVGAALLAAVAVALGQSRPA